MNKHFISFLFLLLTLASAAQSNDTANFTIKAFLTYWNGASLHLNINGKRIKSGFVQNDMCSFNGNVKQEINATLEIRKNNKTVFIPFILEKGTIRIIDKGNNTLEAIGTASNDTYVQVKNFIDSQAVLLSNSTLAEIKDYKRKLAADFIMKNTNSLVSLQLMNDLFYLDNAIDDTTYFILFDLFDSKLKQTQLGKKIEKEAEISRWTAVGVKAPNLVMSDINKNHSNFYAQGKYTLIDFWASWCLPCKKEIPAMVSLFNKYRNENFEMVSISLDTDIDKLKNAINKDKLAWKHLVDFKAWNSEAVKMYGVKTIPMNFLLDQNGIIIAKNLSPEALDEKLTLLLKN